MAVEIPIIWKRDSENDGVCPICLFELGRGETWAYLCTSHPNKKNIGTRTYYCPRHQREVPVLMIVGTTLAERAKIVADVLDLNVEWVVRLVQR